MNPNPHHLLVQGDKYCTNCRERKPIEGGVNKVFPNGKQYRWLCKDCAEKRRAMK